MINAAVSHELRNPLQALSGQITILRGLLDNIKEEIGILKDKAAMKAMTSILGGIEQCCDKIFSAGCFIDFFVHDILDYTLLSKEQTKFHKDITKFDIREAVTQIVNILIDKINLKEIKLKMRFLDFPKIARGMQKQTNYIVKTD